MGRVSDALELVLARHRAIGSPLPTLLRPGVPVERLAKVESDLGVSLPLDVAELFEHTDGVDHAGWGQRYQVPPYLAPGMPFPGSAESVGVTIELRTIAAQEEALGAPLGMWDATWFAVFPMMAGEAIVADCADATIWYVWWEGGQCHQVAPRLAAYLENCARHMEQNGAVFDLRTGALRVPGAEVSQLPVAPMLGGMVRSPS